MLPPPIEVGLNATFTDGECVLDTIQYNLYDGPAITLYASGKKEDCSDSKKSFAALKNDYCHDTGDGGSLKLKCDGTTIAYTIYSDAACATETESSSHESGTCFDANAADSKFKSAQLFITTLVVAFFSFALF